MSLMLSHLQALLSPAQVMGDYLAPLIYLSFLSLGISIGVLISFIYIIRMIQHGGTPREVLEKLSHLEEKAEKLEDSQGGLSSSVAELSASVKSLQESLMRVDSRLTSLESRVTVLERRGVRELRETARTVSYPRPSQLAKVEAATIKDLNEIVLHFPEVRYAGIITSQGYVVKSYGQPSEEPPKMLEVLRISGTPRVSLIRGDRRLEVFYLGDVKDLSIYGILEIEDSVSIDEAKLEAIKETINRYFRSVVSKSQ
ncbi:hypothetical protein IG193_06315 [Infirmifilum lucidum]|uniref:Uncharacterized protein n=1 Tax=Infirmifilum lucidum TaxID=2776706 RepID=A0A7L9FEY6_9CREN|nr:hypothetical protein [Infirmifilum lucidum]QOJ78368.1 hypothetical protein IG193_06315 [Infirmifilum lucidum]